MKLKLRSTGIPDLLPMLHRAPGVHVSEIIHYLCVTLGHYEDSGEPIDMTRAQLGQALEHAIIQRYHEHDPERYIKPGEITVDDISMNCDLFDLKDWAVEEMKLTWMSTNHEVTGIKFWKYWVQLMSYCRALETGLGRLHVCNINGNYKWGTPEGNPTYRVWEAEFTRRELDDNWKMLVKHREIVKRLNAKTRERKNVSRPHQQGKKGNTPQHATRGRAKGTRGVLLR